MPTHGQPKSASRLLVHLGLLVAVGCGASQPSDSSSRALDRPHLDDDVRFGFTVAASERHIAVAAPHAASAGHPSAGTVFVFDRHTLTLVSTVAAPDPADDAVFGYAIALDADRLLVGAPRMTVDGKTLAGAAYLFDAASGRFLRRLTAVPPQANDELGSSVGLHGDDAVVGAPGSAVLDHAHAGIVHLFDVVSGTVRRSLHLPEPVSSMVLGQSLAVAGDAVLVGAPVATSGGFEQAGSVFVFDVATGGLRATLREPTPGAMNQMGTALAGDGVTAVVGAPNATVGGRKRAGAAYVFDLATGAVQHSLQDAANPADGELFGYAVALFEKVVIVGAPHAPAQDTASAGAVYVFDRATGRLLARLTEPRPSTGADFGLAVTGTRDDIVVGAQNGRGASGRGATYAFPTPVEQRPSVP